MGDQIGQVGAHGHRGALAAHGVPRDVGQHGGDGPPNQILEGEELRDLVAVEKAFVLGRAAAAGRGGAGEDEHGATEGDAGAEAGEPEPIFFKQKREVSGPRMANHTP